MTADLGANMQIGEAIECAGYRVRLKAIKPSPKDELVAELYAYKGPHVVCKTFTIAAMAISLGISQGAAARRLAKLHSRHDPYTLKLADAAMRKIAGVSA